MAFHFEISAGLSGAWQQVEVEKELFVLQQPFVLEVSFHILRCYFAPSTEKEEEGQEAQVHTNCYV